MNAMSCRNCGAGLEAGRIDAELGVVTCAHCGSLHDVPGVREAQGVSSVQAATDSSSAPRPEVVLPERFNVKHGQGSLSVTWPVGRTMDGVVLCMIGMVFGYVGIANGLLPLVPASLGIIYYAGVRAFNSHQVRVDRARISVKQGPLPCPGARQIDASEVEQLFAIEHETRTEVDNDSQRRGQVQIRRHYRLAAKIRDGRQVTLLSGLGDGMQALWLEQHIEGLLDIADKGIAGAHTG